MPAINDGQQRTYRNGGGLAIGSDTVTQIGPNGGGFTWTAGVRERLEDTGVNQGELQLPIEGAPQRGTVTFRLPYTGDFAELDSIFARFLADSTDGLPVNEDIVTTVPLRNGATTGESFTFTDAYLTDGIRYNVGSGAEGDMFEATFAFNAMKPTVAAVV